MQAEHRPGATRGVAIVAGVKGVVGAIVLGCGFRAVSDDDFARVVIAEQWAAGPRIDPSGTSWLPVPFWVNGSVFLGVGRGLGVARGVAFLLGIAAILLVHRAALWISGDRRSALIGGLIAAVFPWSARLGVATVPELPTAALALLALAALARAPDERVMARRRVIGGACLLLATLSRYEVWPLALGFAALSLLDLKRSPAARAALLAGAGLALLGPLLWMGWNARAHGDAFHFVARVTAYRKALGGGDEGAGARLLAYPLALLREEPELFALLGMSALALLVDRAAAREALGRFARPVGLTLFQIAALSLAMVKDGAPTHHPERAVLGALLLAALLAGALGALLTSLPRRRLALAAAGALAVLAAIGGLLRPRLGAGEGFTARADEVAVGRLAQRTLPADARALVEVVDYGHLAVLAALGAPERAVLDRSIDPRDAHVDSSFGEAGALRARVAAAGVGYVLARPSAVTHTALGDPLASAGSWAIFRVASPGEQAR
jgi:hypothetical protein